ncbi:MAG: hypothetical protein ACE15D_02920 [Candidatus Eisenbacteria bacterium]
MKAVRFLIVLSIPIVLSILAASTDLAKEWDSRGVHGEGSTEVPEVRDALYCQMPSPSWGCYNASTGFGSELADDIPSNLAGETVASVVLWAAEWAGQEWQPFTSLIVNFYHESCPPNLDPDVHYEVPYSQLHVTEAYAGSWFVYECTAPLNPPIVVGATMSIGGLLDNAWGTDLPYCGLAITDWLEYGCECWWDGDYWGALRWTACDPYFEPVDLAYCLLPPEPVPAEATSWGRVKSLFR